MNIGCVDRVILLGGGELMMRIAGRLSSKKIDFSIISDPRHASERIRGKIFEQLLKDANWDYRIVAQIRDMSDQDIRFSENSFALSLGAAWIFKPRTIKGLFHDRLFNLHGTRLPQNRGGGTFSWLALQRARQGCCLLHRVDGGVDTGEVLRVREFLYPPSCRTAGEYEDFYIERNEAFLGQLFDELLSGRATFVPKSQPEYLSEYWPRLYTPSHSWIDWGWRGEDIEAFVCAFDEPYAGAQTYWEGRHTYLKTVAFTPQDAGYHPYQHGIVYRNNGSWLCVAVRGGTLIVERVLGGDGEDLLADVRNGDRFTTPGDVLSESGNRVIYTPRGKKA